MNDSFAVNFYMVGQTTQWAFRRMYQVPGIGEMCVFKGTRYQVTGVEWCLDADATPAGVRVNVELMRVVIS